MSERLKSLVKYLRAEADFNRSWVDGRRGGTSITTHPDYVARRIELAEEREAWANDVEALVERKP